MSKMQMMRERVPINIWDDYVDDGYQTPQEPQETYMYVEDDDFTSEEVTEILTMVHNWMIANLGLDDMDNVVTWLDHYDSKVNYPDVPEEYEILHFERTELRLRFLTHRRRGKLVIELNGADLSYKGIPIDVYSES